MVQIQNSKTTSRLVDFNSGGLARSSPTPSHPSERMWNSHRSCIVYLYIDQGKKLTEVRKIMQEVYGFDATQVYLTHKTGTYANCSSESMYKKRFTKWDLYKSPKCQRKRAIKHSGSHRGDRVASSGRRGENVEISDRGGSPESFTSSTASSETTVTPSESPPDATYEELVQQPCLELDPKPVFRLPELSELEYESQSLHSHLSWLCEDQTLRGNCYFINKEERFLMAVQQSVYNGIQVTTTTDTDRYVHIHTKYSHMLHNVSLLQKHVVDTINKFKTGENFYARNALSNACNTITIMLREKQWPLLYKLCSIFMWSQWDTMKAVRIYLFNFAHRYARALLGDHDPFTVMLGMMTDHDLFRNVLGLTLRLILDLIQQQAGNLSVDLMRSAQQHAISVLKRRTENHAALEVAHLLVLFVDEHYGVNSDQAQLAMTKLARVHCSLGELKRAKMILEDALSRRTAAQGAVRAQWIGYYICRDLGLVNSALGFLYTSEQYWRIALQCICDIEVAQESSGSSFRFEQTYCLRMLELVLIKQENWEAVRNLNLEHGAVRDPLVLMLAAEDQDIEVWAAKVNDRISSTALQERKT